MSKANCKHMWNQLSGEFYAKRNPVLLFYCRDCLKMQTKELKLADLGS